MNLFGRVMEMLKRTSPLERLERAEYLYVLYSDNKLKSWVLHDNDKQKSAVIAFLDLKKAEAFLKKHKEVIGNIEARKYEKEQLTIFPEELHSAGIDVLLIGKSRKFWKYDISVTFKERRR